MAMLVRDIFIEDVDNDVAMHRQVRDAFRALTHYVNATPHEDHHVDLAGYGEYLVVDSSKAAIEGIPRTAILYGLRDRRAIGLSGQVMNFKAPLFGVFRQGIALNCLHDISFEAVKRATNSTDFMSLFEHEFLHLLDDARTQALNKTSSNPHDAADYLNEPFEYNARYHDLASHLLGAITELRDNPDADARDYADLYNITGDFWKDLARMSGRSRGTRQFMTWLNGDRRRALLKRLYKLHHEIVLLMNAPVGQPISKAA